DETVWGGSLNALSFTGSTGEIMQRYTDREMTAEYSKLLDIEHLCKAVKNDYEQKCPICGEEMLVRESRDGGVYWQCAGNDYSRNVDQPYPLDGILHCKTCGAPYKFFMKKEPRWVCTEHPKDPKHYQKMRKNDLKLGKMAAMLSQKEMKAVEQYFKKK
ncbi:MAG: hypothetical protein K6E42_08845, partial [Synergistes sp.]|nr:hypothetical protein [Synergistes sp.]